MARIPPGIGMTALGAAYVRAAESARADCLFDDPLAAEFVHASGWLPPGETEIQALRATGTGGYWEAIQLWLVVRTRFLDEYCAAATGAGCRQVAILGAGLDARAFRLDWPDGTHVFELDTAGVLDFKEETIASIGARPRCARTVLRTDLAGDRWTDELAGAGFDPAASTAWIAEGLLIYFTAEQNDRLLERVGSVSAPGSWLAITLRADDGGDAGPPTMGSHEGTFDGGNRLRALWRSAPPEDPAAWLAAFGWDATVYDATERAATYGRPFRADGRDLDATLVDAVKL
ncbi:MAG: SAM-dependent methyltransferase [Actinomycetota bacterium]